jgi:hypothetical protein
MEIPLALWCMGLAATLAADYHFDAERGHDALDGSRAHPWRSIAKANSVSLRPGDQLLFHGGQTFVGNLLLEADDAGTSDRPVIVGSYGHGRARIDAGLGYGVLVRNAGGIEVRDLICVGADRRQNRGAGVAFVNTLPDNIRLKHVRMRNLEARGFGRELPKPKTLPEGFQLPQGAGILVAGNASDGSKSGFEDVEITHCESHDNAYYGILITGYWDARATRYANATVRIADCRVFENPGDPLYHENHSGSGILVEDCDGGLVDRCVAFENGSLCHDAPGGPCGIWTAVANRVTIQNCESYRNRTQTGDGDGFDLDGGCTDCVLQYNYSHDNDGAGFLVYTYAGAPHRDRSNVVRWNISENDSVRNQAFGAINVGNDGAGMMGVQVYHNTLIVNRTNHPAEAVVTVHGRNVGVAFRNNLMVNLAGTPLVSVKQDEAAVVFQGNLYWTTSSAFARLGGQSIPSLAAWRQAGKECLNEKPVGLFADPLLDLTSPRGREGDLKRLPSLGAFSLPADSPARNSGLDLAALFKLEAGTRDFPGRTLVPGQPLAIGAMISAGKTRRSSASPIRRTVPITMPSETAKTPRYWPRGN